MHSSIVNNAHYSFCLILLCVSPQNFRLGHNKCLFKKKQNTIKKTCRFSFRK